MSRLTASLFMLLLLAAPATATATAGRDYGESIKALQQERWDRAEDAIRSAIEKEPNAQESMLISGGVRYRYLPYYVLGSALAGQGDCAGAIEAWRESLSQGQIQNAESEFEAMQSSMVGCGTSLADINSGSTSPVQPTPAEPVRPTPADTEPVLEPEPKPARVVSEEFTRLAEAGARLLEDLRQANSRFGQLSDNTDLAPEWSSTWKANLDDSSREYGQLEAALREATQDPFSETAISELESINSRTRAALEEINTRRVAAERRIGTLRDQRLAENAAREEERKRQEALEQERRQAALREQREAEERRLALERQQQLESARRELQQELDRVSPVLRDLRGNADVSDRRLILADLHYTGQNLVAGTSTDEITSQTRQLRDGLRAYSVALQEWEAEQREVALRTPPDNLKQIAEAYFSGDYEAVSEMAQPQNFTDERQRLQAYLFRSAARFNQYWLNGAENQQLLESSRTDIAAIKRLDSDFVPYVAAFSPRYMDFFRDS